MNPSGRVKGQIKFLACVCFGSLFRISELSPSAEVAKQAKHSMRLQIRGFTAILTGLLAVNLHACSTAPRPKEISDAPIFERGFQIFPSPRTFDAPGTIFRIDAEQARHPVADLSGMLNIVPRDEAIPRLSVQGLLSLNLFFSWFGGENRLSQNQRVDSATIAVIGAKREQAFESNLQRVVDSASHLIDWKKPGKVYLITEAVLADSVQIHLSTSVAVLLGDSLKTDSASSHGILVQWRPQSASDIALRFPKPYRVFYKVQQLVRPEGIEQYPSRPLVRLPVFSAVLWREE